MRKKLIPLLHLLVAIVILASPFFLSWKWELALIGAYFLQIIIFGGCVLTKAEFGNNDKGFFQHYINKCGISISRKSLNLIIDGIIIPALLVISLLRTY